LHQAHDPSNLKKNYNFKKI